jgi:hypothetical protein
MKDLPVKLKIGRARTHLEELETEVKKYFQTTPFQAETSEDPETGDLVTRLKIISQPPVEWGVIIGDIIHNLRSALDLLVSALLLANGKTPNKSCGFPVYSGKDEFMKDGVKRVKGLSAEALELIMTIKPYKEENLRLWQLHQLNILDKHQLIIPVASAYKNVVLDFAAGLRQLGGFEEIPPMPLALEPVGKPFPLVAGAELFRINKAARDGSDMKPQFTFELVFGEGEIIEGEKLLPTLREFVAIVENILEQAKPFLVV